MNKFFRSTLLTGILAAGLAACGDDVTVVDPPAPVPPTPQVRGVTVTPDNVTVAPGQTVQMTANVTADSGATPTVTWSTSDATKATVDATGKVTVLATATTGPVAIRATAAANGSTASGAATLNVVGTTVTAVSITPATATVNAGTSLSAPQTVQLAATVTGTNNPAQTVTWSSLDATIASVNATTGLVTANNTATPGNVVIKGCSTVDATKCGTMALTVIVPQPATVQVKSVTFNDGGNVVPVNLVDVHGQIEIELNVEPGARNITRVDALIGGQVVATQTFSSAAPMAAAPAGAPTVITLSTNTAQLRQSGGIFVPVVFNGNSAITANLYVSGSSTPIASNAVPVVMWNADAIVRRSNHSLTPTSSTPSASNGGHTWFKGTQTVGGYDYIAFARAVPTDVELFSDVCGGSNNLIGTGSATGGIALAGTFDCEDVEGGNSVTGINNVGFAAGAVGPDGTTIVPPSVCGDEEFSAPATVSGPSAYSCFNTTASAFQLNGENRWNMINPAVGANSGVTYVDNWAPSVGIGNVAFNDSFDQMWVNASYAFAQDLSASDGGSGLDASSPSAHVYDDGGNCTATVVVTGNDFSETLTSSNSAPNAADWGKRICTVASDKLGNTRSSGGSNYFGIDKAAPTVRFAGETTATPLLAGGVAAAKTAAAGVVSNVANTTIFSIAAVAPGVGPMPIGAAQGLWGMEAIDGRAGFNQNGVVLSPTRPATQSLTVLAQAGSTSCGFTGAMSTVLSDNYVRTNVIPNLVCGFASAGYFTYTGSVMDRAGNSASVGTRNFAVDQYAVPAITGLGFAQTLYTGGQPATFGISANDDLEIIDGTLALYYDLNNDNTTEFVVRYPLGSLSALGTRWDNTLTGIVNGAGLTISSFIGRLDTTLTATNLPSPNPAAYSDSVKTMPDSVAANVGDVAGQTAAAPIKVGMLTTQFTPMVQPWTTAPSGVFGDANSTWRGANASGTVTVTQNTGTSVTSPYFDRVDLYGIVAGELVYCTTFATPVRTDNGVYRTWTYTTPTPVAPNACATATNFRAVGFKGAAALMTQQF